MEVNKQLSIVIPTYNRADFLDYSLEVHIPMIREYNIEICIFDNASTDNTEEVVSKWIKEYEFLSYHKNETNIGPDANFEKALKMTNADYIWLLSDTYKIPSNSIEYILKIMEEQISIYDMFVLNLDNKLNIESQNYTNQNNLLNGLGAIMTCAAINIYKKELINDADFKRYFKTNFIQTGIIFEYISTKDFKVKWIQEHSITSLNNPKLKKTNWSHTSKAFEIGCEDWTNFIMSLPPMYKLENKMKCIMDFGKVSGLFTFKNLILLRMNGLLNIEIFNKYKEIFPFTINYSLWLIFIISLTPKIIFKMIALSTILLLKKDKKTKIINLLKTKI